MSTMIELSLSGARDKFGNLFRDWYVNGWEKGCVPEGYVCWLDRNQEQKSAAPAKLGTIQLDLFEVPA